MKIYLGSLSLSTYLWYVSADPSFSGIKKVVKNYKKKMYKTFYSLKN